MASEESSEDIEQVAVLTSGGDAPGMNAAVRAITLLGRARGLEVHGVRYGYSGLLDGAFVHLEPADVDTIHRDGGTVLGSARCAEFREPEGRSVARDQLRRADMDALIVIGGNGSLSGAAKLADPDEDDAFETRVVGIPASIDNDVGYTGMAVGVDTAMNTIMDACDNVVDTASAFDRTFIVEVMGRSSGYLAMTAGVAAGADTILFPEAHHDAEELVEKVTTTALKAVRHKNRPRSALIVKAEGSTLTPEELQERVDERLAQRAEDEEPRVETRVTVLGHVVRGGRPTAFDRLLAARLGHAAVSALLDGDTRKMAAWLMPEPPPDDVAYRSPVDPYCWIVDLDAALAETQRMLDGTSPLVEWRARVFRHVEDVLRM